MQSSARPLGRFLKRLDYPGTVVALVGASRECVVATQSARDRTPVGRAGRGRSKDA